MVINYLTEKRFTIRSTFETYAGIVNIRHDKRIIISDAVEPPSSTVHDGIRNVRCRNEKVLRQNRIQSSPAKNRSESVFEWADKIGLSCRKSVETVAHAVNNIPTIGII